MQIMSPLYPRRPFPLLPTAVSFVEENQRRGVKKKKENLVHGCRYLLLVLIFFLLFYGTGRQTEHPIAIIYGGQYGTQSVQCASYYQVYLHKPIILVSASVFMLILSTFSDSP